MKNLYNSFGTAVLTAAFLLALPLNVLAQAQPLMPPFPGEDAKTVFTKALEKMDANSKGKTYGSETVADLQKVELINVDTYAGFGLRINNQPVTFEILNNGRMWSQLVNTKTMSGTMRATGEVELFINGNVNPKKYYYSQIDQFKNNKITAAYVATYPISSAKSGQETITDKLNAYLTDIEVPKTVRTKVINKFINTDVKLTGEELKKGIIESLGIDDIPASITDTSSRSDVSFVDNVFIKNAAKIFKLKTDAGNESWTRKVVLNVYNGKSREDVINTKKLVLSVDTEALIGLMVQKGLAYDLLPGLKGSGLDLSEAQIIQKVRDAYSKLEVQVWVNTKTYELEKLYVPKFTIELSNDFALAFEIAMEGQGPILEKSIKVPTKFVTPTQVKKEYSKYLTQ